MSRETGGDASFESAEVARYQTIYTRLSHAWELGIGDHRTRYFPATVSLDEEGVVESLKVVKIRMENAASGYMLVREKATGEHCTEIAYIALHQDEPPLLYNEVQLTRSGPREEDGPAFFHPVGGKGAFREANQDEITALEVKLAEIIPSADTGN